MGNNEFHWKNTDEEEYEPVQKTLLDGFVNNIYQTIQIGSICAIDSENRHLRGYYMVEFSSSLYTFQ